MIKANQVKQLREKTGVSIMECKKALQKSQGDEKKAIDFLKEEDKNIARKKIGREVKQGIIEAYIHDNRKIGALLELNCETDFVAKNEEFKKLAHNLVMHITAMNSKDKKTLLKEPFIKNPDISVKELIEEKIAKLGENIKIGEFTRYEL